MTKNIEEEKLYGENITIKSIIKGNLTFNYAENEL